MSTFEFEYIDKDSKEPVIAKFEQDDEIINVTIGDRYLGTMIEDTNSEFGFVTEDQALQEELEDISMAFKEAIAIDNLPEALHEMYGQRLIAWSWTNTKGLKVIAHHDTDLGELKERIVSEVNEIVLFDKSLTIFLSKEGSGEVKEIYIN